MNQETMTSRDIAELTGKQHKHLMESIRKMEPAWINVNGSRFGLVQYEDSKGEKRPMYLLTKKECLYIATKFNDEARAKLILRWEELETKERQPLSPAELILHQAQQLVNQEKKIQEHDDRLKELEAKAKTSPDYFTVAGYGSLTGVSVNIKLASKIGRKATAICRANGIEMEETPDPRFGKVKTYPKEVLEQAFNQTVVS